MASPLKLFKRPDRRFPKTTAQQPLRMLVVGVTPCLSVAICIGPPPLSPLIAPAAMPRGVRSKAIDH